MNMIKDRDSRKPSSGFGKHKCYACCKVGHIAREEICVLNVVIRDNGQLVVGVRSRAVSLKLVERVVE